MTGLEIFILIIWIRKINCLKFNSNTPEKHKIRANVAYPFRGFNSFAKSSANDSFIVTAKNPSLILSAPSYVKPFD